MESVMCDIDVEWKYSYRKSLRDKTSREKERERVGLKIL